MTSGAAALNPRTVALSLHRTVLGPEHYSDRNASAGLTFAARRAGT